MRTGKRLQAVWCIVLVWLFVTAGAVYGGAPEEASASDGIRVYDMAGLFTEEDIEELEQRIEGYRTQWDMDVVIVTTKDAQGRGSTAYADDFYDEGGFGQGKERDGILFLIDMDNRELTFSTCGRAVRIFTDERIGHMLDGVYEGASEGDYRACADMFLSDAKRYVEAGIQGGQYNYDTETGKISVYRSIRWYEALLALAVSAFTAGAVCMGVKGRYAMEESRQQIKNLNMAYRAEARFAYDNRGDRLVNQFVTSRVIPRSTGGGHGGGGLSSSGRSSTHRSSGGRSHGGGSRKF
ncbi:MAG: TPM domain-containing protein [Hungatella sp.]|nr:TPM domain-containing protein [Hungatella sp.]